MREVGPVVTMYIEKFGRAVTIEADHPLAVAQRAKDAGDPPGVALGAEGSGEPAQDGNHPAGPSAAARSRRKKPE